MHAHRHTDEKRSFVIQEGELGRFNENFADLERKGFSPKPSIDEYVKKLREEECTQRYFSSVNPSLTQC